MKRTLYFLVLLFSASAAGAQRHIVNIKISKPYCLLNFIETAAGHQGGHSATLMNYISDHIPASDTVFRQLVRDFNKLVLNYSYKRDEFPDSRRPYRSTYDLICIAAVQSDNLVSFRDRITGILPNSEQQKLFRILSEAIPYYDRILWNENKEKMASQIKALQVYQQSVNELFLAFKKFYRSSWAEDIPFTVALYPIPGKEGHTSATPHANSLCVGVLTGEKAYAQRAGVILHEMCHVLYDEQPSEVQHSLDSVFNNNTSPYSRLAGDFFDEAVATALGNGYAYQYIQHKADTTTWYANEYIDAYAHALYPLLENYLQQKKSMDAAFINEAIQIFGKTFPQSVTDYSILLNNVSIYSDVSTAEQRNDLINSIMRYFQLSHYGSSSPITDEHSIQSMQKAEVTRLIILDGKQPASITALQQLFPSVSLYLDKKENYILSFFDTEKRPVIIIRAENEMIFDKAMRVMNKQKNMQEKQVYMPLL